MNIEWPPIYRVRLSRRARRVLLKISLKRGLEIVVPHAYKLQTDFASLLVEHKPWIETQLIKLRALGSKKTPLPTEIKLLTSAEHFTVNYYPSDKAIKLLEDVDTISIHGNYSEQQAKSLLRAWLFGKAKQYLPKLLNHYSQLYNLTYSKVSVKKQKTRWGSCTAKHAISLNYQLMLLPLPLSRYIMIHELCHTKELNHSAKFWYWVQSFEPKWREYRQQLCSHGQLLPDWVLE